MHLLSATVGDAARAACAARPPFGPGVSADELAAITSCETWGSGIKDPGDDYCEFRTFGADGKPLKTYRIEGY